MSVMRCGCGDELCTGIDSEHHQCGGPREACGVPGCTECGHAINWKARALAAEKRAAELTAMVHRRAARASELESERDAAIARASDFERQYFDAIKAGGKVHDDWREIAHGLEAERDALAEKLATAEAGAAAMRVELLSHRITTFPGDIADAARLHAFNDKIDSALASETGAALLKEVEALRALEREIVSASARHCQICGRPNDGKREHFNDCELAAVARARSK